MKRKKRRCNWISFFVVPFPSFVSRPTPTPKWIIYFRFLFLSHRTVLLWLFYSPLCRLCRLFIIESPEKKISIKSREMGWGENRNVERRKNSMANQRKKKGGRGYKRMVYSAGTTAKSGKKSPSNLSASTGRCLATVNRPRRCRRVGPSIETTLWLRNLWNTSTWFVLPNRPDCNRPRPHRSCQAKRRHEEMDMLPIVIVRRKSRRRSRGRSNSK